MIGSAATLKLGGFLLVHALWVVSDLPPDQIYVPSALCETASAKRELVVFEAQTQGEAIGRGKAFLSAPPARFVRCAFARDGRVNSSAGYIDVLSVSLWERGKGEIGIISQPYRTPSQKAFALVGQEVLIVDGKILAGGENRDDRLAILEGIESHSGAAILWRGWNAKREAGDPLEANSVSE